MTYDKQDLLLDLRRIATDPDIECARYEAAQLLVRFIDDEHITQAYQAIGAPS